MASMSKDTREYLEQCIATYNKTGKKDILEEIKKIFENHRDDPTVLTLKKTLRM